MKRMLTLMAALLLFLLPLTASADHEHAVAYIDSRFNCGCSRRGTGAMIGRYGLITAGHNLYCSKHGESLKSCDFYFGAESYSSCWYEYNGSFSYRVYDTFKNGYRSYNDIGYVIFDTAVGDRTGWFGWMITEDYELDGEITHEMSYDSKRNLSESVRVVHVDDGREIHWAGWSSGTEGGPIFFDYGSYVVAVYTCHDKGENGYGRRLTQNIIKDMRADGAFD